MSVALRPTPSAKPPAPIPSQRDNRGHFYLGERGTFLLWVDNLRTHGRPEVFNSDQGSQFTREAFTQVLMDHGITISMDGRGRALDNLFVERLWRSVTYEDVYLRGYASMSELPLGLTEYFAFYNAERRHPSLGNRTPDAVYHSGEGCGASIVDRFGGTPEPSAMVSDGVGEGLAADLAA